MNKTELIAKAKLRLRKMSADTLDEDVEQLINVALADLKRIGVHSSYLDPGNITDPLIIEAALVYAKANFGNPENHGELMAAYDMICTKIKGAATIEAIVTLLVKKNQTEYLEKEVFAEINPVGRDEFTAAGQKDYKASMMIEVWGFEYEGQTEVMVDGRKMAIYRTYGPKNTGKVELYAGERIGKS